MLCPAESTIRTATRERESTPQASLNTRKAMYSTASAHARQIEPLQTTQQATNRSDSLTVSTSRKTAVLFRSLDVADSRLMDPGYGTGLSDSFQRVATKQADSSLYLYRDREQVDLSRGGGVVTQASTKSDSIRRRFHQQHFLSAKRKRQMEADPQSQSFKSLHRTPALQNGRYPLCKGPPEQGGLYVQTRLEGCLPFHPNHSVSSKVPQICMAGDSSTMSFHSD